MAFRSTKQKKLKTIKEIFFKKTVYCKYQ